MAQPPTPPMIDLTSIPSSNVGTSTQETLPFQQQIENYRLVYSGPSLIHGNARSVHEVMSPRPGNATAKTTGQTTSQTSQSQSSTIPPVDLAAIPEGI
eukprot:5835260-Amphidinium_carterae.1